MLPGLGELLRYEAACQPPCTPVYERRLGRVSIDPKTGDLGFRCTKEQIKTIEEAKTERELYNAIKSPGMPAPDDIDERWAVYRNMQVNLVAGLDFIWRYGPGNDSVTSKTLPNQYLDLEYLVIALLAGGIATKEGRLQDWFKLLHPEGGTVLPCLPAT